MSSVFRVPDSCCLIMNGEATDCNDAVLGAGNKAQTHLVFTKDCVTALFSVQSEHARIMALFALIFGLVVILAACIAICLYYLVD